LKNGQLDGVALGLKGIAYLARGETTIFLEIRLICRRGGGEEEKTKWHEKITTRKTIIAERKRKKKKKLHKNIDM